MKKIDFEDIEEFDLNSFDEADKKDNFINKRKPSLKGTDKEKTKILKLAFTEKQKDELSKYKTTLGATTFNGILYKLIELGLVQHKKDLKKILKGKG